MTSSNSLMLLLICLLPSLHCQDFDIPLPFGNIEVTHDANGDTSINTQHGLNFGNNGFGSNSTMTFGNGTFNTSSSSLVDANGQEVGGSTSLGAGGGNATLGSSIILRRAARAAQKGFETSSGLTVNPGDKQVRTTSGLGVDPNGANLGTSINTRAVRSARRWWSSRFVPRLEPNDI